MRRARQLVATNAHAAAAVDAWAFALVGAGLKPQSQHQDRGAREALNVSFEAWTDQADVEQRTDFYGLQLAVAALVVRDGECFIRLHLGDEGLELHVVESDMIDESITRQEGDVVILQGIELDRYGRRIAYHVRRQAPDLTLAPVLETVRVPASEMLHIFRGVPGQVRGASWFGPVLQRMADYDGAVDAQLVRQKIAALMTGFVTSADASGAPMVDGSPVDGIGDASLEPGEMRVLLPGQDVRFSDPARVGAEVIDFLKVTRREIAAGLGLPAHLLDGDLSDANYSSLRAGLLPFRRKAEALQYGMIVHQFLRPVWARWVEVEAMMGRLPIDALTSPAFRAVKWITPRMEHVDPAKDTAAELAAISAGLSSRREAVAGRGWDIESLDAEIAADRERERGLGLDFSGQASTRNKS